MAALASMMPPPSAADPTPTSAELLSLTHLILSEPTPPPFTQILTEFAAELSPPWVLNFLFSTDPIHITHLTSSTLAATSTTAKLTTTRAQPPAPLPAPDLPTPETHHELAAFLLVPVLTLAGVTIGIGCGETLINLGAPWLPPAFCPANLIHTNFRFVRNAKRHSTLVLTDAPDHDAVMIYYARNETLTRCHSFQASFRRTQFLDLARDPTRVFDVHSLLPICHFIVNEVQYRPCPFCAAPLKTPCDCEFPVPTAAHPFDSRHFFETFIEEFGIYQGVASKFIPDMESGHHSHIQLGVRVAIEGFLDCDNSFLNKMRKWSVGGYFNAQAHDPRHSNLSNGTVSPMLEAPHPHPLDVGRPAQQQEKQPVIGIWEQDDDRDDGHINETSFLQETVDMSFVNEVDGLGASASLLESDHATTTIPFVDSNTTALRSGSPPSSVASTEPSMCGTVGAVSENEKGLGNMPLLEVPAPDVGLISDTLWWEDRLSTSVSERQEGEQGVAAAVGDGATLLQGSNVLSGDEIPSLGRDALSVARLQRPVGSAAATIMPMPVALPQQTENDEEVAKRMKAEERRRRNRLSAQRSNMKRKEACDAIRVQIKGLKSHLETLREKQDRIRKENEEMKKRLGGDAAQ